MFLQGDCVVTSASDLASASTCEFAFLRALDAKLGRIEAVIENDDPLRRRAAGLGIERERRVLERYREELGDGGVGGCWRRCGGGGGGCGVWGGARPPRRPSRSELLSSSRRVFVTRALSGL